MNHDPSSRYTRLLASGEDHTLTSDSTFETPKPTRLLKRILQLGTSASTDSIVLDFFAGSGAFKQAAFDANAEDGGSRRAILVQLPESLNLPEGNSHALQTIADVCKERIRNAGATIKRDTALSSPNLDTGFRVLKIDTSNMRDVYYALYAGNWGNEVEAPPANLD